MTSLLERPVVTTQHSYVNKPVASPVEIIPADAGRYSLLELARAYFAVGERPIPLCDANHAFVSAGHINCYLPWPLLSPTPSVS